MTYQAVLLGLDDEEVAFQVVNDLRPLHITRLLDPFEASALTEEPTPTALVRYTIDVYKCDHEVLLPNGSIAWVFKRTL